jgi:F0F1-type ATP synthase alpha subunit
LVDKLNDEIEVSNKKVRKQKQVIELFETLNESRESELDIAKTIELTKNSELKKSAQLCFDSIGIITGVADGVVTIEGLSNVSYGETVEVLLGYTTIMCLILNLEAEKVSAIVLDDDREIRPGQLVFSSGVQMRVPTHE